MRYARILSKVCGLGVRFFLQPLQQQQLLQLQQQQLQQRQQLQMQQMQQRQQLQQQLQQQMQHLQQQQLQQQQMPPLPPFSTWLPPPPPQQELMPLEKLQQQLQQQQLQQLQKQQQHAAAQQLAAQQLQMTRTLQQQLQQQQLQQLQQLQKQQQQAAAQQAAAQQLQMQKQQLKLQQQLQQPMQPMQMAKQELMPLAKLQEKQEKLQQQQLPQQELMPLAKLQLQLQQQHQLLLQQQRQQQQKELQQKQQQQLKQLKQPASTLGLYSVTVPPGHPNTCSRPTSMQRASALCVRMRCSHVPVGRLRVGFGLHRHVLIGTVTVAALRRLRSWKQNKCQRARQRPSASDRPSRQSALSLASKRPAVRLFACTSHAAHHFAPTGGGTSRWCNMRHEARRSQRHSTGSCDLHVAVGGCHCGPSSRAYDATGLGIDCWLDIQLQGPGADHSNQGSADPAATRAAVAGADADAARHWHPGHPTIGDAAGDAAPVARPAAAYGNAAKSAAAAGALLCAASVEDCHWQWRAQTLGAEPQADSLTPKF
jgi:chemotaxis protein histidine kinase CheA